MESINKTKVVFRTKINTTKVYIKKGNTPTPTSQVTYYPQVFSEGFFFMLGDTRPFYQALPKPDGSYRVRETELGEVMFFTNDFIVF